MREHRISSPIFFFRFVDPRVSIFPSGNVTLPRLGSRARALYAALELAFRTCHSTVSAQTLPLTAAAVGTRVLAIFISRVTCRVE